MKLFLFIALVFNCIISQAQPFNKLILKGDYSVQDSINITTAYIHAKIAVEQMQHAMDAIWEVEIAPVKLIKYTRAAQWRANSNFLTWLGEPVNISKARRKINKIAAKFQKDITLEVINEDKGRCGRFVSAWTVPYGKVKIRLCRNFVNFESNNQSKTIIHELGHEAGLLFDRGVYHGGSAKSVAANTTKNRATRRPENYAWLAMSYLGVGCGSR